MIGLSINHKAVLGVIYQPEYNIFWQGIIYNKYIMAQKINTNKKVKNLDITSKKSNIDPIIVVSKNCSNKIINIISKNFNTLKIIKKSSIGLKITLIADGKADIYITNNKKIKLWDTCAPSVILRASGGELCEINGKKLTFKKDINHKLSLFAVSPNYHNLLNEKIKKFYKN